MLHSIRKWLGRWRRSRELRALVEPEAFAGLSRELRDLARIAAGLWPDEPAFQDRVKRIQDEMNQLEAMAVKPEFLGIPTQKRLELRQSLLGSRDQLMETVRRAQPPTSTTQ
ncbi:MAG: hypothetical protein HQK81_10660 [Desulfovibrionaceae bacterium]|nr:hypothetical protein [Desulfovibrionaceae bacterium]MBF0514503.1 hypothetical protein [Desulfovibrionaceae bacterium]